MRAFVVVAVAGLVAAAAPRLAAAQSALPGKLAEDQAIVFAAQPGGQVEGEGGVKLKDGQPVKFVAELGMSPGEDPKAIINVDGKPVNVPNARLITEARLRRSPDGNWAIFSAMRTCAGYCYGDAWLLGKTTRQKLFDDASPKVVVAYSLDGKEVAVGSGRLVLITLANPKPREFSTVTAPAYAPDGTLFARGAATDDGVYQLVDGEWKRVVKFPGKAPDPEPGTEVDDPEPVRFEGDVLVVEFDRGNRTWEVRATRAGKILKKKKL